MFGAILGALGGGPGLLQGILGGIGKTSEYKQEGKLLDKKGKWAVEQTKEEGNQSRLSSQYESGLADYYRQLERQRKRQGFSNFGQFSRNQYEPPAFVSPDVGAPPSAAGFTGAAPASAPSDPPPFRGQGNG